MATLIDRLSVPQAKAAQTVVMEALLALVQLYPPVLTAYQVKGQQPENSPKKAQLYTQAVEAEVQDIMALEEHLL